MIRGAVLGLAMAAVCLFAAGSGVAEEDEEPFVFVLEEAPVELTTPRSEIELGFLWGSDDSFKFGDFTGLEDRGFSVLGNADILWRTPYNSETAHYLRLRGLNLGLDSRWLEAAVGEQGLLELSFLFRELPKFQTDSAQTFFLGTRGTNLRLPPEWDWDDGGTPAEMEDNLDASLRRLEVDHKRRRLGGAASLVLPMNMEFETRYVRETKKGEKLMGAVIGSSGGNPRAVILPEQLDYVTDQVDAKLRFAREDLQLQLQYYGSGFHNENDSVTWENPYVAHEDWNPAAGWPTGRGRKGQPPDNWFHQVSASGGYNLPLQTRVTLNAALGWMLQDADFLPFTVNSALACDAGGTAPCALPRDSLGGRINTRLVDFGVASRPLSPLRLDLGYRYDERDNETPRNVFQYLAGDSADQEDITSSLSRINRPYSLQRHQLEFDAGYQIFTRTNLTLGYEWERSKRDYQEVAELDEHKLKVKLHGRPCPILSAGANYERSWRDGSSYIGVNPQLTGESPEALVVGFDPATYWENHPLLRKYYLADRERDDVRFFATLMPFEKLNVGLNLGYARDNYENSKIGLTRDSILSSGVDLSFFPTERVTTHAFYTFERIRAVQEGWSFRGFAKATESVDPGRRWTGQDRDRAHTAGFGLELDVVPDRLGFGADYAFTKTHGMIAMGLGAVLLSDPSQPPFPDVRTRLHNLNVHAEYELTANLSVRVGYLFEDFESSDWALDGVDPGTLSEGVDGADGTGVIATGEDSPDYRAHVVAWSLVLKFW